MSWSASCGVYFCPVWLQMPICRNIPSMPKVRASSGTMGTTYFPISLSRASIWRICTRTTVVDGSRSSLLLRNRSKAEISGTLSGSACVRREGRYPPSDCRRLRMYSSSRDPSANLR